MPVVTSCPCGEAHDLPQAIESLWDRPWAPLTPAVVIAARGGRFLVPRIYIECHGLAGVAEAARRYGFAEA